MKLWQRFFRGGSNKIILILRGFDRIVDDAAVGCDIPFRVDKDDLEPAFARPHLHKAAVGVYTYDQQRPARGS